MDLRKTYYKIKYASYYSRYRSRKEYYEKQIFPRDIISFNNILFNSLAPLAKINVDFRNIDFGSSEKSMLQKFGTPNYSLKKNFGQNIYGIFFYKEKITTFEVLTQVHFINGKFFYACNTFKDLNLKDILTIKKILLGKYTFSEELNIPEDTIVLKDDYNNKISIVNDVYFRISYLAGNEELLDGIKSIIKNQLEIKAKQEDTRFTELYDIL